MINSTFTLISFSFSFTHPPTTEIYTLSLHDALPILLQTHLTYSPHSAGGAAAHDQHRSVGGRRNRCAVRVRRKVVRSEEHTSELQSRGHLVCRLLLEKKKKH